MSRFAEFTNAETGSRFLINVDHWSLHEPRTIVDLKPQSPVEVQSTTYAAVMPNLAPTYAIPIKEPYIVAKSIFTGKKDGI